MVRDRAWPSVSGAKWHTCAADAAGAVYCWSDNSLGKLGDGTTEQRNAVVAVRGFSGITLLNAGGEHTCVLDASRRMLCWGGDRAGEPGFGRRAFSARPVEVVGLAR